MKKSQRKIQPGIFTYNIMILVMAVIFIVFAFITHSFDADFVAGICVSLAIAMIPTAFVTIFNSTVLYNENKERIIEDSKILTDEVKNEFIEVKKQIGMRLNENERFIQKCAGFDSVGLTAAYESREKAFNDIYKAIALETSEIYITATSLKGLIECFHNNNKNLLEVLIKKKEEKVDIKFLLVHPAFAYLRELTERYKRGQSMADTIIQHVKTLGDNNFDKASIRFVYSTPTVFGVMTSRYMILNPYPLQGKSYETLTLVFDSLGGTNSIFNNYKEVHFKGIWEDTFNTVELESFDEAYLKGLTNYEIVEEILWEHYKN